MQLSIITINYNNLEGLIKTYNSIVCQSFTGYEWIIIDGGSSDGSKEFVEHNQSRFQFWCSEPDGGIYEALNKGLEYTNADYVCFMNSGDCFADKDTLQTVFSVQRDADILYGDAIFVYRDYEKIRRYPDLLTFNWLCHDTINHQAAFTRRKVFEKLKFDTKYRILADRKFWLQCMLNGYSFQHIQQIISVYDYNGYSSQNSDMWEKEFSKIKKEVIPEGLRFDLDCSYIYETHSDLRRAFQILKRHCIQRKILHWCIKILCKSI